MSKPITPLLTVDCVLFDRAGRLLLIERKNPPFQGGWALPGGFVDLGETVEDAAARELEEETSIAFSSDALSLIGVFSAPDRDPRGHTVSVAFGAVLADPLTPRAADDAARAEWVADWRALSFAFDHGAIIDKAATLFKQTNKM